MKKIQKKDIILFIILFIISSIIYWNYITMHYATDTYNIMNIGYIEYAINNSLNDGRLFMFVIGLFAESVQLPINVYVIATVILAIGLSCITVIILKNMIINIKPLEGKLYKIIPILISYITIFNFMYVENLYFVEATMMALSILLYTMASKTLIEKKEGYIKRGIIYVVLATFSYQGTIGFYILLTFVLLLIRYKSDYKKIVKEFFMAGITAVIAFLANLALIQLSNSLLGIKQQRLNGIQNLKETIVFVAQNFYQMVLSIILIESCWLFPKYYCVLIIAGILLISFIYKTWKKEHRICTNEIAIILLTLFLCFIMCVVSISSYDTGRIHYPMGALIGILFLYLYCDTSIMEKEELSKYGILFLLFIYIIATINNTILLLNQHKRVNELEKEQCKNLEKYIKNYEEENNIQVTKARYFKFSNMKEYGFFDEINNRSVLCYDGVACTWSSIGTINFYTKRGFRNAQMNPILHPDIWQEYVSLRKSGFEGNFVCIGDTLYYLAYI